MNTGRGNSDDDTKQERSGRGFNPRVTGLLVAFAIALIGGGVVLFVALLSKPEADEPVRVTRPTDDDGEPTDITAVGSTSEARIQVEDKNRPGRVAADLFFKRLDQAGGGAYDALEPRAFIYLADGRTIFVRSDTGRVRMPTQSDAPESGEFSGNGLLLVFPPRSPGSSARPIDPDRDEPGLVATFNTASFDTVLLELSTRDELTIQTPEFRSVMQGALIRGNQAEERIEFARFGPGWFRHCAGDRTDGPTADPDSPAPSPDTPPNRLAQGNAGTSPEPARAPLVDPRPDAQQPGDAKPPKQDHYRTHFTGAVTLVQDRRKIAGDALTVWSRFIDNKLPEGALGRPAPAQRNTTSAALSPPHAAGIAPLPLRALFPALSLGAANAQTSASRELFTPRPDDIVLTWNREVTTAPIAASTPPKELAEGNHVHARFTSDRNDGNRRITLTDSAIGAIGVCGTLDYAATTRRLALSDGPGIDRVDFVAPSIGRFSGKNLSIDLSSGVGQVRGGGTLLSLQSDDATVVPEADPDAPLPEGAMRRISWLDQADFVFHPPAGERGLDGLLNTACFTGEVLARDNWSSLSGDFLKVDFDRFEPQPGTYRTSLRHLRLQGGDGPALAVGAPSPKRADPARPLPPLDPYIEAETLDIEFKRRSDDRADVDPTLVVARGTSGEGKGKHFVTVADDKVRLTTMNLVAELRPDSNGKIAVGDLVAEGQLRVERNDGVWAAADKLVASGADRWADLTAEDPTDTPVALALADRSIIRGPQVHLEDGPGVLHVFGVGTFDHLQPLTDAPSINPALAAQADPDIPPGMMRVRASWSRSMLFVNQTGRIECHGDAEVSARSAVEGRVARCERLLLDISPADEPKPASLTTAPVAVGSDLFGDMGDRRLLRAELVGASLEREGGAPASVKAWTFGLSGAGERTFDRVLYLESARIGTDEDTGVITVPEAGTGLIFDAGRQPAAPGSAGTNSPSVGPSGDTRFRWNKSLAFDRKAGELMLLDSVELEHLALGGSDKIVMRSQSLGARFDPGPGGGGRLLSATCGGGAIAESGTQLLTADEFIYDGLTDTIRATTTSDQPVMLTDTRRAAPVVAKSLIWDRRADRIEVVEPMPVIAPMGK